MKRKYAKLGQRKQRQDRVFWICIFIFLIWKTTIELNENDKKVRASSKLLAYRQDKADQS